MMACLFSVALHGLNMHQGMTIPWVWENSQLPGKGNKKRRVSDAEHLCPISNIALRHHFSCGMTSAFNRDLDLVRDLQSAVMFQHRIRCVQRESGEHRLAAAPNGLPWQVNVAKAHPWPLSFFK